MYLLAQLYSRHCWSIYEFIEQLSLGSSRARKKVAIGIYNSGFRPCRTMVPIFPGAVN